MADERSSIQFEDVPLEEARHIGRGPRMDPELYQELRTRVQSLSNRAVRMTTPDGIRPKTMSNWVRSIAAELSISVTTRRVPGGLVFWHSTEEDIQLAQEVGARLQSAQRPGRGGAPVDAGADSGIAEHPWGIDMHPLLCYIDISPGS